MLQVDWTFRAAIRDIACIQYFSNRRNPIFPPLFLFIPLFSTSSSTNYTTDNLQYALKILPNFPPTTHASDLGTFYGCLCYADAIFLHSFRFNYHLRTILASRLLITRNPFATKSLTSVCHDHLRRCKRPVELAHAATSG
jgi:hypothetical protein